MQIVLLSILLATTVSVFCEDETVFKRTYESSNSPSLSDNESASHGPPLMSSAPPLMSSSAPLPNFSMPEDTSYPNEPCSDPPCSVIIVQNDNGGDRTDVHKSVDEAFGDRVVRWLVVAKSTHIDRIEETSDDFLTGKKKKVLSENRQEQLQVLRDSRHAFYGNELDLVSVFK